MRDRIGYLVRLKLVNGVEVRVVLQAGAELKEFWKWSWSGHFTRT